MKTHPGTDIPCKTLSKSELAGFLQISTSTLRTWRQRCEYLLEEVPGYNKYSPLLSPLAVEIILKQNGYIRENPASNS